MNQFDFDTEQLRSGGYIAKLRTAGDGDLKPILQEGGRPIIFGNEVEALRSLLTHLCRYVNGHLVRDGEVAGETRSEAEGIFKPVLRQKGKSRVITVAYKGQRQRCGPRKPSEQRDESPNTLTEPST
ncbi:protein of unknown function [Pseudorhizobium banfieldiae]|uniref:Uncharacterized protein n=1 Tax=Pseudorhizobium banfieldiae TaxID=1125847 RepID=L0NE80_9HYPH|nr:hypothetical protein [Pseudorhizobium banfieldiae]CAD6606012.1 hypothetical protein RNT25_01764 [arsenite-oxidising bacterium NT-25]CCF19111.1 protein of unknown function [Pseudorhizobium banfieldiae]